MRQPKALSIFFLTEMWERYGFYLCQSLLILFLLDRFHFDDATSYAVLGSVTALAYINSIIGGYVADRFIGHRLAVLLGAVFIGAGYALLALGQHEVITFWALGIITMGTGLIKPNISSLVGTLYTKDDPRRQGGFTLFYVGINVGTLLSTSCAGYLQQYCGWTTTFFSGTIALGIAFATFLFGIHHFKLKDVRPFAHTISHWIKALGIIFLAVVFSYFIIEYQKLAVVAFVVISIISVCIVFYEAYREEKSDRRKLMAYLILSGISVIYWSIYFQLFFSMNLFVLRAVDRNILGHMVPPSLFMSVQAMGILVFGPLVSMIWTSLQQRKCSPSIPMKFALSLILNSVAFGLLFISSMLLQSNGMVMPGWVILVYVLIAIGELFLSPVGLSMVTELVPPRLVGLMMGIFFISLGLGGKLAGVIANISAVPQDLINVPMIEAIYRHAFLTYFLISAGAALVSLCLVPVIKHLIGDK